MTSTVRVSSFFVSGGAGLPVPSPLAAPVDFLASSSPSQPSSVALPAAGVAAGAELGVSAAAAGEGDGGLSAAGSEPPHPKRARARRVVKRARIMGSGWYASP